MTPGPRVESGQDPATRTGAQGGWGRQQACRGLVHPSQEPVSHSVLNTLERAGVTHPAYHRGTGGPEGGDVRVSPYAELRLPWVSAVGVGKANPTESNASWKNPPRSRHLSGRRKPLVLQGLSHWPCPARSPLACFRAHFCTLVSCSGRGARLLRGTGDPQGSGNSRRHHRRRWHCLVPALSLRLPSMGPLGLGGPPGSTPYSGCEVLARFSSSVFQSLKWVALRG